MRCLDESDPAFDQRMLNAVAHRRLVRLEKLATKLFLVSMRAGRAISPDQAAVTAGDILDAIDLTHERREETRKK